RERHCWIAFLALSTPSRQVHYRAVVGNSVERPSRFMVQQPTDFNAPRPEPRALTVEALTAEILAALTYSIGKDPVVARPHDWLYATILAVRHRAVDSWMESTRQTWRQSEKRVYYLSLEFLIGRLLRDAMSNLGLMEAVGQALNSLG